VNDMNFQLVRIGHFLAPAATHEHPMTKACCLASAKRTSYNAEESESDYPRSNGPSGLW
jgi:hypothetical protein